MTPEAGDTATPRRVGFVVEDHLGHRTHAQNLRRVVAEDGRLEAVWLPLAFQPGRVGALVPGYGSNWTVRAGLRARAAIRRTHRERPLDAVYVHSQVPAVLASSWFQRIPAVVSLDATPIQYDSLGDHYDHQVGGARTERLKFEANRRSLHRARRLVVWSRWARDGLVDDYDLPADRIEVIPPGVDLDQWAPTAPDDDADGPVRILFVGGDLERKGGDLLVEVVRSLRAELDVRLDLVTGAEVRSEPGITVHRDLEPNSSELLALTRQADVFCLPSRADCLPLALVEAGAAGLATVATDVGALGELVVDGRTGLVVPPGDRSALGESLRRLVCDPELRRRLGGAFRAHVAAGYDATRNGRRLVELLVEVGARDRVGAR